MSTLLELLNDLAVDPHREKSRKQVEANARWRAKNPGKQAQYMAIYRDRNRDSINERRREARRGVKS